MQRINTTTKYPDKFGVGKHGFRNGDLASGVVPTDLVAEWFDGVQEEISRVIEASGATLDGTVFNQLYVAITTLIQNANYDRPGRVNIFLQGSAPSGWLPIHGLLLPRNDFPGLTAHALSQNPVTEAEWAAGRWGWFSVGDGATTIRIPDVRAMFVRALDASRGIDAGRLIGSYQAAQMLAHAHGVTDLGHIHPFSDAGHGHPVNDPSHDHAYARTRGGGVGGINGGQNSVLQADDGRTDPALTGITIGAANSGITIGATTTGISINTSAGGSEVRVANVAWPFYMKY